MWKPVIIIALALSVVSSCKKDDKGDKGEQPAEPSTKATKPDPKPVEKPTAPTEADAAAALDVMKAYEVCREQLAADKPELADCAKQIADAAAKAPAGVAKKSMAEIATAAKALAEAPADDIDKLRIAFGDVSKPVETMLTAIPKVAAKYKMFECPMAKGFGRWAQPGDQVAMANPYMGTKMLECGSEVHDHHGGAMKHDGMKHDGMKHDGMKHGE